MVGLTNPTSTSTTAGAVTDEVTLMSSSCEEKWSDWFNIRNYQFGNRYVKGDGGKCLAPCVKYFIPNNAPANDPTLPAFNRDVAVDKCISKNHWGTGFGTNNGKFMGTQDFCPLVVIKRTSSTPTSLRKDIKKSLAGEDAKCANQTTSMAALDGRIDDISQQLSKTLHKEIENVNGYSTNVAKMADACNNIINKEDRVKDAYEVCRRLKDDTEAFVEEWGDEIDGTDEDKQKHLTVLRQACNVAFCGTSSSLNLRNQAGGSAGPDICFSSNAGNINTKLSTDLIELGGADGEEEKPGGNPSDSGFNFMNYSVYVMLFMLLLPVIVLVLLLFYYSGPTFRSLLCLAFNALKVPIIVLIYVFYYIVSCLEWLTIVPGVSFTNGLSLPFADWFVHTEFYNCAPGTFDWLFGSWESRMEKMNIKKQ